MLDIRAVAYIAPVSEVDFASVALTVRLVNYADGTGLVTGLFRIYDDSTGLLIHSSDIVPVSLAAGQSVDVSALTDFDPPSAADDRYFVNFDGSASNALVPDGIVITLGSFWFDVTPTGMGPAPAGHHLTHESGGADEVDHASLINLATGNPHPQYELAGSGTAYSLFYSTDLLHYNAAAYWLIAAIGGGGSSEPSATANHPGIRRIAAAASANTGGAIRASDVSLLLAGTEKTDLIFRPQVLAATMIRFGFLDTVTSADAVDGCYIEITQVGGVDGVIVGKTSNNSARSTTATNYTLVTNTWYRVRVEMNDDATLVTFTLMDEAGATLWTDTLNTNIPTARVTGHGIIAIHTDTTAHDVVDVDYMDIAITRALTR